MDLAVASMLGCAENTATGIEASSGSFLCASLNSQPSITGIIMSRRITDGLVEALWRTSNASRPFEAVSTAKPSSSRTCASESRTSSSSSTTSTLKEVFWESLTGSPRCETEVFSVLRDVPWKSTCVDASGEICESGAPFNEQRIAVTPWADDTHRTTVSEWVCSWCRSSAKAIPADVSPVAV